MHVNRRGERNKERERERERDREPTANDKTKCPHNVHNIATNRAQDKQKNSLPSNDNAGRMEPTLTVYGQHGFTPNANAPALSTFGTMHPDAPSVLQANKNREQPASQVPAGIKSQTPARERMPGSRVVCLIERVLWGG